MYNPSKVQDPNTGNIYASLAVSFSPFSNSLSSIFSPFDYLILYTSLIETMHPTMTVAIAFMKSYTETGTQI